MRVSDNNLSSSSNIGYAFFLHPMRFEMESYGKNVMNPFEVPEALEKIVHLSDMTAKILE